MSYVKYLNNIEKVNINLPSSKSIYNRLLILKNLYNLNLDIKNQSDSDDSILLRRLFNSEKQTANCKNAGTVIRFLAAYYATKGVSKVLRCSKTMEKRPIGELVYALRELGAEIDFVKKEGFPPIKISGNKTLISKTVEVNANQSSQFISALLMIGPSITNGLKIKTPDKIMSKPYIEMTIAVMKQTGFEINQRGNIIEIAEFSHKNHQKFSIKTELDWSAAAFWVEIVFLSKNLTVNLSKLKFDSIQGDSVMAKWANKLGISIIKNNNNIIISKFKKNKKTETAWDFKNNPDLAPAVIVMLASAKLKAKITGVETLKIKESNRIFALKNELYKCNVDLIERKNHWEMDATNFSITKKIYFKTYYDHRIAMALAPLAIIHGISISTGKDCKKSYPKFWGDLVKAGFKIKN